MIPAQSVTVDSVDMQKSCRIEGCQRKFDKTSHSDLCPPCSNAFRSGETQTVKRAEHQQRQQNARAQALSANRNIPLTQANSPPQPTTTQGFQFTTSLPTSLPIVSQPMAQLRRTEAGGRPVPTPSQFVPPPPPNNLASFPQLGQSARPLPNIDVNRLYDTFTSMESGGDNVNPDRAIRDMYGMMLHMFSQSSENERVKTTVNQCVARIDALEAKIGNGDEVSIPLSLAVRNMPLPSPGVTDLQLVQAAFKEIRAQGVDCDRDMIKVSRLVDTSTGRLRTMLMEMRSVETKAQIMKNKKCLESHPSEGLRKLIIGNPKTKSEIKTNIVRIQDPYSILDPGILTIKYQNSTLISSTWPSSDTLCSPYQPQNVVLSQAKDGMLSTQPHHAGPAQQQHVAAGHTTQLFTQSHHNIPAQYQLPHGQYGYGVQRRLFQQILKKKQDFENLSLEMQESESLNNAAFK